MSDEHKPLPVQGYTAQPGWKVDTVNENKVLEEQILRRLDGYKGMAQDVDQRWLAIGRTKLEEAFMAINRSVFQPQRAKLPTD